MQSARQANFKKPKSLVHKLPSKFLRAPASFESSLCLFWHGIFEGKKYPVCFYSKKSRTCLKKEVERSIEKYANIRDFSSAGRLSRLWELILAYIQAQNESTLLANSSLEIKLPASAIPEFLHLLYHGKPALPFWKQFLHRYKLRPIPISSFWDYFEEFQPSRMQVLGWLGANAHGKILDLGAGAHSYIKVDVAADISLKALKKNKFAKKKIKILPLDELNRSSWPFGKHSFDTIMLNSVLSYVKNRVRLFRLCRSTLKDGGILLITNSSVHPHHPASFFIISQPSASQLAKELKMAGFCVLDNSAEGIAMLAAKPIPPKSSQRSKLRHKQ
jgi:hypothetical protein